MYLDGDDVISACEALGIKTVRFPDGASDAGVQWVIRIVEELVDNASGRSWEYRQVGPEEQPWMLHRDGTWTLEPDVWPPRTVVSANVYLWYDMDGVPEPQSVPPTSIRVRDNVFRSGWRPWSTVGGWRSLERPMVDVTYTAGYDNGAAQADGLTVRYPEWLKQAAAIIAAAVIIDGNRNKQGLGGLTSARFGQVSVSRSASEPGLLSKDFKLPQAALDLLQSPDIGSYEIIMR